MGSNVSKTVASGGIQDSQEGLDYQWKSMTLFAVRSFALQQKVKSFAVLTEIQEAKKFDDAILEYTDQHNNVKYILAQAKHRKIAKVLDSNSLIAEDNFSLVKYFASFWEISQKYGAQEIESVMIITNNTLEVSNQGSNAGQDWEMKIHKSAESLYFEKTDHFIFGSIGEIYRFVDNQNSAKRDKVFRNVRIIILSYELASLCIKKPKTNFLSQNQKYLFDTIIDDQSLTIKQDFLSGTLLGFEFFSQTFDEALKIAGEKSESSLTVSDKIALIQNHFKNIFDKTFEKSTLMDNQIKSDNAIDQFLDKLLYITKLKTDDLQNEINSQLREIFIQGDVEEISAKIELRLTNWLKNKRNKELAKNKFEEFIVEIADRSKLIIGKDELFEEMLDFQSILPDTRNFLNTSNPSLPRILRLETSEDETHFAAMRIVSNYSDSLLYLRTSFSNDNIKQIMIFFEKLSCFKLLVIELHKDSFKVFNDHENELEILQNDPAKKLVVIGDANLKVNTQNIKILKESESYFTDLTAQSQNKILNEKIHFQDQETTWRAVLDGHDLHKILLKDVLRSPQLGKDEKVAKSYSEKIYIPRTILYNNCLKSSILQRKDQQSNDVFVSNKDDFEQQQLSQFPHHLIRILGNQLEWIKSTKDLSIILKHIDESNPRSSSEDELAKSHAHITIISDVAGMGKSTLFCKLAEALKEHNPTFWIYKFDMNDHSEALKDLRKINLRSPEDTVEFIGEKIMKLESEFEKYHFVNSCTKTGKVILLIDGVDEIFSSYGEEVVKLMKLLSQTKIHKIFISTRPECCERLEKEFLQIKHSLEPFSESDQKKYFLDFLRNHDKLKDLTERELNEIVEAFLESMKRSIRAKDYKHTGVPLITKLVAEFLEEKIFVVSNATLDETVKSLKSEKFCLTSLYESFRIKSFDIYFKEKCGMDKEKAMDLRNMNRREEKILENYKIFAIQQFLKKDATKFFPSLADRKFSDAEMEEMLKVGLIYETDDGYKFVHQTFAENLFTLFLVENFEQPEVAKFIVHTVFIEDKFEVIRSFMEYLIEKEKMSPEISDIYFEVFLSEGLKPQHTTPIQVSLKEQNTKIFDFIYNCLTKHSKFKNEKSKVENYLLECGRKKVPVIFDLIVWSENLNQILDSVKNDCGSEFVFRIFRLYVECLYNKNVILQVSSSSENFPYLLKWMRLNLSEYPEFLQEQIFSVATWNKNIGILHYAFRNLSNQTLSILLDEIESWGEVFGKDLIRKWILMQDGDYDSFLSFYTWNENYDTDFAIETLDRIKIYFENDESFLTNIILRVNRLNNTLFGYSCTFAKNFDLLKVLTWFHNSFGFEIMKNRLLSKTTSSYSDKTNYKDSIIFNFLVNNRHPMSDCLKILKYLKDDLKLDEAFLKDNIIFARIKGFENVLQQVFLRSENLDDFSDFVKEFNISDPELKTTLAGNEPNFLYSSFSWFFTKIEAISPYPVFFYIAQKSLEDQEKYLNFLKRKLGENILNELISNRSLFDTTRKCKRFDDFGTSVSKYLDFVERNFGTEILKKLIGFQAYNYQTFLFGLNHIADRCLMKILNYLFEKFKNEKQFLEQFLLSVDNSGNTFLIHYFSGGFTSQAIKASREFPRLIKSNFGSNFLKKLLLIKNKQSKNFHQILLENKLGGVEESLEVLEILIEVVGKDREFFVELTKQNEEIPEEIKEFLKAKLLI